MQYCELPSPVGRLLLGGDETVLRIVSFQDGPHPLEPEPHWEHTEAPFREVIGQLKGYFARKLRAFDLPLAPQGTPFQQEVWRALRTIPYGETRSYGELAQHIGRPRAFRAVGSANARNPIPIVIPCHRVVGAAGSLTGFGGGLPVKHRLLTLEGALRDVLSCPPAT
jgi:methylated-DNA-[protein]-cysteine S-methyltransferase